MSTEELTREETITEPPKRWRNWWRATGPHRFWCDECGVSETVRAGAMAAACCRTWPSRDVAESVAEKNMAEAKPDHRGRYNVEYLGAYPEGERP